MSNNCVKCGGRGDPAYHASKTSCAGMHSQEKGEHLHYVCRVCKYDWTTPAKDSKSQRKQGGRKGVSVKCVAPLILWSQVPQSHRCLETWAQPRSRCCVAACRGSRESDEYTPCGHKKSRNSQLCGTHKRAQRQAGQVTWAEELERLKQKEQDRDQ